MVEALRIAVPELAGYDGHSGIGRVVHSLIGAWGPNVDVVEARYSRSRLPLLRNSPFAVRTDRDADVIFLPKLSGAEALKDSAGVPSVVVVHDVGIVDCALDRAATDWLTHKTIARSFTSLPHATHVVAVSKFTETVLLRHLPDLTGRTSVISNGVDPLFVGNPTSWRDARSRLEAETGQALGSPLLLYVGSELPRKNFGLLLGVLKELQQDHPQAQLIKVGRPGNARWRQATLRELESLGLSPDRDVLFLQDLADEALANVYRAADVFVSASLYEGFGLPALEAIASLTPVVVTDRGALPEVVGEHGRVVEPELAAFTDAVESSLSSGRRNGPPPPVPTWSDSARSYLELMRGL